MSDKSNIFVLNQNKKVKYKKSKYDIAIEECNKLYAKNCAKPNPYVINQLKKDKLNIYLNNLKSKDLSIIRTLLTKFFFFKHIELSPFDPEKDDCRQKRKFRLKEIPSTQTGFSKKKNNSKNALEKERTQNISKIIMGISRYLCFSDNIVSLSLNSISLSQESSKYLAQGLFDNKTLQGLNINYCEISLQSYENILKSLLKHEALKYLDLSNNNFSDKYGEMVALVISSQSQRRDQALWASGLRNEVPQINEYSKGLISINLKGNKLGNYSADCISKSLSHDQYIRIIDLSGNNLDNSACKKFIHMMRKNNVLLTVDLRENPGYDEAIYQRMIMKMSKNIRFLYQQFQNGDYTEEEFDNLKEFIDISFFDVDIPQEIVDYYNGNIQDTMEDNGEEIINNDKIQIDNMNMMNDIQERAEEEEDEETIKTMQEKAENKSIKNINKTNKNNSNNKNTEEENKKLIEENLRLKEEILELKSQKNGNDKKNDKGIIIKKPDDPNNIEENYNYIVNLVNELNEVMNNIEKIKNKKGINKEKNNININKNDKNQENIEKNKEDNYIEIEDSNELQNIIIDNNNNKQKEDNINENYIQQVENQENNDNIIEQEIALDNLKEKENESDYEEAQKMDGKEQDNINNNEMENENYLQQNVENSNENNNNNNYKDAEIINDNDDNKVINVDGEEQIEEEGENDDEDIDYDKLTEEEKIALMQQREILQKLQEEAAARGEQFDVQEYLDMLEKQANEEEEEEGEKNDDKVNKSF